MKKHYIVSLESINEFIQFTTEERKTLTHLYFKTYGIPITLSLLSDDKFERVCSLIAECCGITHLMMWMQPQDIGNDNRNIRLWQALKQLKNLEDLSCEGAQLERASTARFSAFCDALKQYKLLQSLSLRSNIISKLNLDQCSELGRAISQFTALRSLDLEMTELGKCGKDHLQALLNPLSNCLSLNALRFFRNQFETASRETLIAFYVATSRLKPRDFEYILDGNKLGPEDIRLLLSGLLQSCNLNTVVFSLKNFPFSIVDEILSNLSNNQQLEHIFIELDSNENAAIDISSIKTTCTKFEQFPILFNINFRVRPINSQGVHEEQIDNFITANITENINRKNHYERLKAAVMALSGLAAQEDPTKPQNNPIPTEIRYQILSYAFRDNFYKYRGNGYPETIYLNAFGPRTLFRSYYEGVDTSVQKVYTERTGNQMF